MDTLEELNREKDLFEQLDQANAAPGDNVTVTEESLRPDPWSGLRELQDSGVHVGPAGPRVDAYPQLRTELGDHLSTLETEVHELIERISQVLAPGNEVSVPEAKAPGHSPLAADMAAFRDRVAALVAEVHDAKSRVEVGN